jgi:hypothetical protein
LQVEFDPETILSILFAATSDQQPFDFWIDEVRFLSVDETGGGGAPGAGGSGA